MINGKRLKLGPKRQSQSPQDRFGALGAASDAGLPTALEGRALLRCSIPARIALCRRVGWQTRWQGLRPVARAD